MPQEQSWKQLFKASILYISFIAAIVFGFFGLFIVDQIFRVQEIIVKQTGKKIALVGLKAFENESSLLLDTQEVAAIVKRDNPSVDTVSVSKEYPNKLYITVTTRSAIIALQGDVGYYLLASDATILEKVREEPKNIPKITYYQKLPFINFQAGQKLNHNDLEMSIEFYQNLQKLGLQTVTIDIQDYSMIRFLLKDEKEIRVSAEKDKDLQWYQIERLVKDLGIQGEEYKLIDVRFEKPYYQQANSESKLLFLTTT